MEDSLSTEAGTMALVVADCTITLAGYLSEDRLLNVTLLPALLINLYSFHCLNFPNKQHSILKYGYIEIEMVMNRSMSQSLTYHIQNFKLEKK